MIWLRAIILLPCVFALFPIFGCARESGPFPKEALPKTKIAAGLFEDATARAGILFKHTNGDSKQFLFPETFGGGCAFIDYDNDGWPDVLLLSCGYLDPAAPKSANLALYHNNHDGSFTDVTSQSGLDKPLGYAQAVAVGDYDNDGLPDIFVAGYGGCHLFHNRGKRADGLSTSASTQPSPNTQQPTPLFEDVTIAASVGDLETGPRWASGAVWLDYDNDGKLDLFVIHYAVWSLQTDKKCPRSDGAPGYCVPNVYEGDGVRLFHNLGAGKFEDVTQRAGLAGIRGRGLAVAALDFDGDGKEDIYIANDLDRNFLLRNNGNGTFTETAKETGVSFGSDGNIASGMGIALGDYEQKGRESVFVTNLNGEKFSFFKNEGKGLFSYATDAVGLGSLTLNHSGWGVAFLDYDRDGWPDIVSGNGNVHPYVSDDIPGASYEEPKGLYHNNANGTFSDASEGSGALLMPRAARGLAAGDFDNDGRIDILCINRNERADLFRNVGADNNHWISIKLAGTRSNRDGAGAKVTVESGGTKGYAECRLGSSYASSSDSRLYFGLGHTSSPVNIRVQWPSGTLDAFSNVQPDGFYIAAEGKSCVADSRIRNSR